MATLPLLLEELTLMFGPAWVEGADRSKAPLVWRMLFRSEQDHRPTVRLLFVSGPMDDWLIDIDIAKPVVGLPPTILGWALFDSDGDIQLEMDSWKSLTSTLGTAAQMFDRLAHIRRQLR